MKVLDGEKWRDLLRRNDDEVGRAVTAFAERWADLMEEGLEAGVDFEDVALSTPTRAAEDGEDLGPLLYFFAVSTLCQHWAEGERLRRWYNLANQVKDEGQRANETPGMIICPFPIRKDLLG